LSDIKKCLVTIPAFGSNALTHAVLPDVSAESDLVDVLVIDNGGHYEQLADEWVIRPGENIGWAGASNLGFRLAFTRGYEYAATLNNDTRLSPGFFAGLLDSRLPADLGIVGPTYDGWWSAQASDFNGAAGEYDPRDFYRPVLSIDGTALMISAKAWERVGGLDERTFGRFAWGSDIDLSVRVQRAGFGAYITERSFVHHLDKVSASEAFGKHRYFLRADRDCKRAFRRLYSSKQLKEIRSARPVRIPLVATSNVGSVSID
jgi:GT2 family glycosyltransferase